MITQARIIEWYQHFDGKVFVSFSGGKDSTVLLDIVRKIYPDVSAVFVNTGLEYPEIQSFVRDTNNVQTLRPKMQFTEVVSTYGYPVLSKETAHAIYYARKLPISTPPKREVAQKHQSISVRSSLVYDYSSPFNKRNCLMGRCPPPPAGDRAKSRFNKEKWLPAARDLPFLISHQCCNIMKKSPSGIYQRKTKCVPILGTMAEESVVRRQAWLKNGCNAFDAAHKSSQPMSFWREQDVLEYIVRYGIKIAPVYGSVIKDCDTCKYRTSGCKRTGCVFCGFGLHMEKGETRFQSLALTHPKQYEYCIGGGQWVANPYYDPFLSAEPDEMGWVNWNPRQIWVPSKKGLGMGKVFDLFNEIYGKDFMRYE